MNNPTITALINLKGKHIKQLLERIERLDAMTPEIRKSILDEINDLMREVFKELGYNTEVN